MASNVTFITHDVTNDMLNNMNIGWFNYNVGCIEIMNNVFIGANTIILPNIKIGSNVIIAAGSVITKDIEDNSVVAGVPAKKIETFDNYIEKRKNIPYIKDEDMWNYFNETKRSK